MKRKGLLLWFISIFYLFFCGVNVSHGQKVNGKKTPEVKYDIISRVTKEIKQKGNVIILKRGFLKGRDAVPIFGWVGVGATITIKGEMPLKNPEDEYGYVIISHPTEPLTFIGMRMPNDPRLGRLSGLAVACVIKGRGIVIHSSPDQTNIYVFGINLSSLIPNWERMKDWIPIPVKK